MKLNFDTDNYFLQLESDEVIEAICYSRKKDDEKNKCILTNKQLIIIQRGVYHYFKLIDIKNITIANIHYTGLLVLGTLSALFSILFLLLNILYPLYILLFFLISILSVYIGWHGTSAILVNSGKRSEYFSLIKKNATLSAFLNFSNNYIATLKGFAHENILFFFIPINKAHISLSLEEVINMLNKDKQPILCYTYTQWKELNYEGTFLMFNPLNAKNNPIHYRSNEHGELHPYIYGQLNCNGKNFHLNQAVFNKKM